MRGLKDEIDSSILLVTHDLAVAAQVADRIAVMYSGKLAEIGSTREVLERPLHPYTSALISSIPRPDPSKRTEVVPITGEVPSSMSPPPGCRFNPRCPYAEGVCRQEEPALKEVLPAHWTACHFSEDFLKEPLPMG